MSKSEWLLLYSCCNGAERWQGSFLEAEPGRSGRQDINCGPKSHPRPQIYFSNATTNRPLEQQSATPPLLFSASNWTGITTRMLDLKLDVENVPQYLFNNIFFLSLGSGVPEVRSMLAGFELSPYSSLTNMFIKFLGLTCTLAAGSTVFLGKVVRRITTKITFALDIYVWIWIYMDIYLCIFFQW